MHAHTHEPQPFLRRLWNASPPLTATGFFMLGLLAASVVGLWLDPRIITGVPAWLKPTKFAISVAIYVLTLAWVFTWLPEWRRMRRWVGIVSAIVFVIELVIIDLQAWRGTTSHFNTSTALNGTLFSIMGAAIFLQTFVSVAVALALWRQRFEERAMGWALRLGMTFTIVGAMTGGMMTGPTAEQLAVMQAGGEAPIIGAHTVGAPDGGPGVPGTNWSLTHGDLRIAHFVGLHSLQVLPILAFVLRRRRVLEPVRSRLVQIAAASYAGLWGVLLWQALRAQSLVRPDGTTLTAFAIWAVLTIGAALVVARGHRPAAAPTAVMS